MTDSGKGQSEVLQQESPELKQGPVLGVRVRIAAAGQQAETFYSDLPRWELGGSSARPATQQAHLAGTGTWAGALGPWAGLVHD